MVEGKREDDGQKRPGKEKGVFLLLIFTQCLTHKEGGLEERKKNKVRQMKCNQKRKSPKDK